MPLADLRFFKDIIINRQSLPDFHLRVRPAPTVWDFL
jgi:hypothetical protein